MERGKGEKEGEEGREEGEEGREEGREEGEEGREEREGREEVIFWIPRWWEAVSKIFRRQSGGLWKTSTIGAEGGRGRRATGGRQAHPNGTA